MNKFIYGFMILLCIASILLSFIDWMQARIAMDYAKATYNLLSIWTATILGGFYYNAYNNI